MTTPLDIISRSLKDIGALAAGETASPEESQDCLDMMNDMIDNWSNQNMLIYNVTEIIFPVTAGQTQYVIGANGDLGSTFIGSISGNILTITSVLSGSVTLNQSIDGGVVAAGTQITSFLTGAGGVVNAPGTYKVSVAQTVASTTIQGYFQKPLGIDSAFVRINTTVNGMPIVGGGLDYPVAVIGLDQYETIGLKSLNGPWPKAIYYNANDSTGNIYVWPSPAQGELHLFAQTIFPRFNTLTDNIQMPQGYFMALRWSLSELIMPMFGKGSSTQASMIMKNAAKFRGDLKSTNMVPAQIARYDSILNSGRAKDAAWIYSGGFN